VQWRDSPLESPSWEPSRNIDSELRRSVCNYIVRNVCIYSISFNRAFHNPQPQEQDIKICVDRFCAAVDRSLSVGLTLETDITMHFPHDIYRYLFGNKTELRSTDFDTVYFPQLP